LTGGGHQAQRTCMGCRQVLEQDRLVRYVLSPGGELLIDYRHRLPGRGAYTCVSADCLREAVRRRQFDRALRREAAGVDADALLLALRTQILQRVQNLLGMARKASQAVSGSNLVLAALGHPDRLALVLMAADVSPGIAGKVSAKAAAVGIACYRLFDKETLGELLGKGERSIVGLTRGRLAETIKTELSRYENIVGER
jgi:predicted RNA-binding protein YlxR (DUF448 family)